MKREVSKSKIKLKCLVTGATGLLGRHLVDVLVESGVCTRAFVRRESDIRRLVSQGVELALGEAADEASIGRAVEGMDIVFHAAGYLTANAPFAADGSKATSQRERTLYQALNVDFTEALLAASTAAGCRRFVYISSSSVYAADAPVPTPEDAPLRPISTYGCSKLQAEEAVRAYQDKGLPATIIRPPVTYGPGDRYFTPLAMRLSRLPVLPLVNGGRSLMDLVYVGDVAELMWRAALRPEAIGRIYNAGPGQPTTLSHLVQAFRHLTGGGPRILSVSSLTVEHTAWLWRSLMKLFLPEMAFALSPQGIAMMNRDLHLSMQKAMSELDFQPGYTLEEGLKETIEDLLRPSKNLQNRASVRR